MSRIPWGAEQLVDQVKATRPNADVEPVGEPDGLDVYRDIGFDQATGKWLKPLLEAVDDERIEDWFTKNKRFVVRFVPGTEADLRDEYPLDLADQVISE